MEQEQSSDTKLLNIEAGEVELMEVTQLIDNFANLKARKVKFN